MRPYLKTWKKASHRRTPCVSCHQEPGLLGALSQRAGIIKHYSISNIYFRRYRPMLATVMDNRNCLGCHEPIMLTTVKSRKGVLVSHKEINAAGLSCSRCHAGVGHASKTARIRRHMHEYCFACHQKPARTRACSFCHTNDIGSKGRNQIDEYRKVELDLRACDGCHATSTCKSCHPEGRELVPQ